MLMIGSIVRDKVTGIETTIVDNWVEIDVDSASIFTYLLGDNVPLSPDYPTRWRHSGELENTVGMEPA